MARPRTAGMTVERLARLAGVSQATASKVFGNRPDVSDGVRARVLALADAAGFRPQAIERPSATIAAVIEHQPGQASDFSPWLATVLSGIADYTQRYGLAFSVLSRPGADLGNGTLIRDLRRRRVDGAVVLRANRDSAYLDQLEQQGFPFVCVLADDGLHHQRLISVSNQEIGLLAGKHLRALGHRRAGLLRAAASAAYGDERRDGFMAGFQGTIIDVPIPNETTLLAHGAQSAVQLARMRPAPTAVFCLDLAVPWAHCMACGMLGSTSRRRCP